MSGQSSDPISLENQDDATLVKETLNGNADAFGVLAGRYKSAVMGYCYSRVRNRYTAEDLSQETFLRAFQALDKLKNARAISTWLMSIAHNICVDYHRRKKNVVSLEAAAKGGADRSSHLRMDIADTLQTPVAQKVINEETHAIILEIIGNMSDEYRVTLGLRYGKFMSCDQIAVTLGVSVGTITSRLSRSHKIIREEIRKRLQNEEKRLKTKAKNG